MTAAVRIVERALRLCVTRRWEAVGRLHWPPLNACVEALRLLAPARGERVLDIGSGSGNLCAVGALATSATFVGVEQRPALVKLARRVARTAGAERAVYLHG